MIGLELASSSKGIRMNKRYFAVFTFVLGLFLLPADKASAKSCGHAWAVPGTYTISGNFRGKIEAAGARLTRDCRVTIKVPGVSSGTKVKRAGKCLRFRFKVDGVKKAFTARWCNKVTYIPWKGKRVRARVKLVKTTG